MKKRIKIDNHFLEISNPNKLYFFKPNYTKMDLIAYYYKIAERIMPYLRNRPLVMRRFPNGIKDQGFYQKQVPDYFPKWINKFKVKKRGDGYEDLIVCDKKATLIYIVNQGCITPHIWLSSINKINYPDKMIFDLDPSGTSFTTIKNTALIIKKELKKIGLESFVKTTGSRGLHVVIPLESKDTFEEVRLFAKKFAQNLVEKYPQSLTIEHRLKKRGKRIFLDYLRNAYAQTGVAPYAVRPITGAPVSTPLAWKELGGLKSSQQYHIKNIFKRLAKIDDPWSNFNQTKQSLKGVNL